MVLICKETFGLPLTFESCRSRFLFKLGHVALMLATDPSMGYALATERCTLFLELIMIGQKAHKMRYTV